MSKEQLAIEFSSGGDAVPGGYNGYFVAYGPDGEKLGYLDYQSSPLYTNSSGRPAVLLAMVEVEPRWRRQGVATQMIERLLEDFPDHSLSWGYMTPGGAALKAAWDKEHPTLGDGEQRAAWYHGSSLAGLAVLEPGLPSNDHIDRPRPDAVYLTRTPGYAITFGQHLYRADAVDESLLLPDEDAVFDLLEDPGSRISGQLRLLWQGWQGGTWEEASEMFAAHDDFSALSQAMVAFADFLAAEHPLAAGEVLAASLTAAYPGSLPVTEIGSPAANPQALEATL